MFRRPLAENTVFYRPKSAGPRWATPSIPSNSPWGSLLKENPIAPESLTGKNVKHPLLDNGNSRNENTFCPKCRQGPSSFCTPQCVPSALAWSFAWRSSLVMRQCGLLLPALTDITRYSDLGNCCILIFHNPFCTQKGFRNDPEPYDFILFEYEPISSHMDSFHVNFH